MKQPKDFATRERHDFIEETKPVPVWVQFALIAILAILVGAGLGLLYAGYQGYGL